MTNKTVADKQRNRTSRTNMFDQIGLSFEDDAHISYSYKYNTCIVWVGGIYKRFTPTMRCWMLLVPLTLVDHEVGGFSTRAFRQ